MNPDSVRILPVADEHLSALSELAGIIWRSYYPGIITPEQIEYMLERMYSLETLREEIQEGIRFDRLLVNDEFAGFASYGPTDRTDVFKLHRIYLHPIRHRQGMGTVLLQHCEVEARKLGARRLMLTVNKRNAQAFAAYRKNGFAIVDSVVADIGGGFVMDDYVMAKDLDPAAKNQKTAKTS